MANPEHLKILEQGVKVWNKWRQTDPSSIVPNLIKANLARMKLYGANFFWANLSEADLRLTDLGSACLIAAKLERAHCRASILDKANLAQANLIESYLGKAYLRQADLHGANLQRANLEDADLRYCNLVGSNFEEAVLTGVKLYATSRDNWIIKDVECKYVYWDHDGEQRSPKDRDLAPGEFERLYASLPTIEYIFEHGMTPIDPLIMDRIVQAIQERRPDFDIKIDSINARGLAPSIKFTVRQEEHKEPALQQVKKEYEIKLKQLESERDRYYRLLARALDVPKEVKLIAAGPGAIIATDGSTVNIQQHIHNALELQKAIADEHEESENFAKVAKKTALDIIGEAIKDIAKGQVKEAAKQIIELGKDLGPIIAKTAAYAFFSNIKP